MKYLGCGQPSRILCVWNPLHLVVGVSESEALSCRVILASESTLHQGLDVGASWPELHPWILEHAQLLNRAFCPRVKKLDLSAPAMTPTPDVIEKSTAADL